MREAERIDKMQSLLVEVRKLSDFILAADELSLFSAEVGAELVASSLRLERIVERVYAATVGVELGGELDAVR
ncbi:MAG: hypothetical protein IJG07_11585 [Prevotella sp.]|nr:hypothetical protein [Prevotella sp.]